MITADPDSRLNASGRRQVRREASWSSESPRRSLVMTRTPQVAVALAAAAVFALSACESPAARAVSGLSACESPAGAATALPQGGDRVTLDPADFTVNVTNRYWPMEK